MGTTGCSSPSPVAANSELTAGPVEPAAGTGEDLLVLYVGTIEEVRAIGAGLVSAGVLTVESPNPYWNRFGQTFLHPDGYRIVIARASPEGALREPTAGYDEGLNVEIDWHVGRRAELRRLFEFAEDSHSPLDQYLDQGRVLVQFAGSTVLGHLQLVLTTEGSCEGGHSGGAEVPPGVGIAHRSIGATRSSAAMPFQEPEIAPPVSPSDLVTVGQITQNWPARSAMLIREDSS